MVKVAEQNSNYFTKEHHGAEVVITEIDIEESRMGSKYFKMSFEDAEGREGNTGYNNYLTEKALPYTAGRIQGIAVHNCKTDKDKEKMRAQIESMDEDVFVDTFQKALIGKKAFLVVSDSENINPNSGKPYLQFNLQGYAPKSLASPVDSAKKVLGGGEEVSAENLPF